MKKRVLLIDEEPMDDEIASIQRHFKNKGHEIEFVQFNIGSSLLTEVLTNNQIDLKKVKDYFHQNHRRRYDLICFDYNLSNDLTGVDILFELKPLLNENSKLLFYSGLLDEVIDKILSRRKGDGLSRQNAERLLKRLIQARVEDFVKRENLKNKVVELLSQNQETLDEIFAEKMELDYPNFRTEYFDKLELYKLSQLLNNSDGKATKFKHEIVEQFISYLIRLHEDEE